MVVDLLFASSGIEPEIVGAAETVEVLAGVSVPVATVGHLIALKLLARDDRARPQDHVGLLALMRIARPADLTEARRAVALIRERGSHRGRDLAADLDRLLKETAS